MGLGVAVLVQVGWDWDRQRDERVLGAFDEKIVLLEREEQALGEARDVLAEAIDVAEAARNYKLEVAEQKRVEMCKRFASWYERHRNTETARGFLMGLSELSSGMAVPFVLDILSYTADPLCRRDLVDVLERQTCLDLGVPRREPVSDEHVAKVKLRVTEWEKAVTKKGE